MGKLKIAFAVVAALLGVYIGSAVLVGTIMAFTGTGETASHHKPAQQHQHGQAAPKDAKKDDKATKSEHKPKPKHTFTPTPTVSASASSSASASASSPPSGTTVTVVHVVDGDTFDINRSVQGMDRVRLIGVDTPEVYGGEELCGQEASAYTTRQLEGQTVSLEIGEDPEDPYDRLLAYVFVRGELYNETLVSEGLADAVSYPPNTKYDSRFEAAEASAKTPSCGSASSTASASPIASASASSAASAPASPSSEGGVNGQLNNGVDDVNCSDLSGPVPVDANDEDGLDADGDGMGCD